MSTLGERCYECHGPITDVYRSPYFCAPCDRKRIKRIDNQLRKVSAEMGIPYPGNAPTDQDGESDA